jgi:putative intracellular protease/amidase
VTPEDIDVLALIGYAFGWSYFELKDIFEGWGCNFTTTGENETVQSCLNKPPNPVDPDILVSEIDRDVIRQFDCLVIPSGGHWADLKNSEPAIELIQMAYEEGLVVGAICIGVAPVCYSNITQGKLVTGHNMVYSYARDSGATILPFMNSVIDGQIVTGDGGDGVPDGYLTAPHFEFCRAVMMKLLGFSFYESITMQPILSGNETVHHIDVTTSGPLDLFGNVSTPEIAEVTVKFHTEYNDTIIDEAELSDLDGDALFTGSISGLTPGRYVIDLHIIDANVSLEVVRNVLTYEAVDIEPTTTTSTGTSPTTSPIGTDEPLMVETMVLVGAAAVVVVVVLVIWRRR